MVFLAGLTLAFGLALCVTLGFVWNLLVVYSAARMKIPISATLERLTYIPWGISIFCLGIVLYFVFQCWWVSLTGRGTVLFFDSERAARRVARALGYSVKARQDNAILLRRMRKMSEKKE